MSSSIPPNIQHLLVWIHGCLIVAAIGTTAVPVIYAFAPWRKRLLGKIFMMKAISFAMAIDMTLLFVYWKPDLLLQFWINAIVLTAIAISTSAQAGLIWYLQRHQKKRNRENAAKQ